nr:hypothetical protein CFP56_79358 [Quercus suber]
MLVALTLDFITVLSRGIDRPQDCGLHTPLGRGVVRVEYQLAIHQSSKAARTIYNVKVLLWIDLIASKSRQNRSPDS